MFVYLIKMELGTQLERVRDQSPGNSIAEVIGVVYLGQVGDWHTHGKRWKGDVLYPFILRRLNDDAGGPVAGCEALGRKAYAEPPVRLADDVSVEKIAGTKLVDRVSTDDFGIAQRYQLRAADKQCVEA